ncbi:short-chain dehydrogenase [Burkholderia cenocepacia]|uniref:short-chain dehydrogenase n=1 Tax=Burkholderia cenocepacia TaxID=95486 RepID=UPI0021AB3529|nr:short-chain dehydrogenase [Burkholderia cenocepacia]
MRALSDGPRQEHPALRITCVNPGVVESELADTITHAPTQAFMREYRAIALQPADIGRVVRHVIESPASVSMNEPTIRPTGQTS